MRKSLYLWTALSLASASARSELVYLPAHEVLDTNTNLIWLNPSGTAGMGLHNPYTQNGWTLSTLGDAEVQPNLKYGRYSLPSMITGTFPSETDFGGGGAPYNPAFTQLLLFLGGHQYPSSYVEIAGLNRTSYGWVFGIGIGYGPAGGSGEYSIEGSESEDPDYWAPSAHSKQWLYRTSRSGPIKWTIERHRPGGPNVAGTFDYDQDEQIVSNVRIKTSPSPYPENGDDYGILHERGAFYTKVVTPWISPDGRLEGMILEGTPIGTPDVRAYYYLGIFDGGLGNECHQEAGCGGSVPPGQMAPWIDATDASEIVCAEGAVIGISCFGWEGSPSVLSYRYSVGSGNHRVAFPAMPTPSDADNDGLVDAVDNCTLVSNVSQLDADGDGYGNICDADLNNSGLVTAADFAMLRSLIGESTAGFPLAAAADLNGSGTVTAADYAILRSRINTPPGPSGLHP